MTAVASPPNLQPISRTGWSAGNGASNGLNSMSSDDVTRMLMPRRSAQRSNSSSSLASQASSATITSSNAQPNGAPSSASDSGWASRKKPARSLWPPSKAEPISGLSGLSTQRQPSVSSVASGSSASSAISALHSPNPMLPSQHGVQTQTQQNGAPRQQNPPEAQAILHLLPINGTFERKTISVPFYPDVVRIGRQTNAKTQPTPMNGYFDSKVLSRQHAEVWADRSGKIWIRDIKSSNGTFVNGQRLSQENRDSDPHELREQDMLELGIDIVSEDQKTVVHHKVAARVENAGIYSNNFMDLNLNDLDPSTGGLVSSQMQGMGPMRGRAGSAGSAGVNGRLGSAPASVAGSNVSAVSHQRNMSYWLSPVTVEQVVKKLNTELKQAKQQSHDLNRTTHYMDTLLTKDSKKDHSKSPHAMTNKSPIKDGVRARFSDPPAPPPRQPLPEKPDVARAVADSVRSLQRSDTERPKIVTHNSAPIKTDSSLQITSLVEALTSTKKELDTQSARLKDLEDRLEQERLARESAEERAQRLELETQRGGPIALDSPLLTQDAEPHINGVLPPSEHVPHITSTNGSHDDIGSTARLQQRLELMVQEMDMMKQQMEKYRRRAETAEESSANDRRTLAEMVDRIRQDEAARVARDARRQQGRRSRTSSSSPGAAAKLADQAADAIATDSALPNGQLITTPSTGKDSETSTIRPSSDVLTTLLDAGSAHAWLRRAGVQPGATVAPAQVAQLETLVERALLAASQHRRSHSGATTDTTIATGNADDKQQMLVANAAAPFASMLGVVIVGVGLMAWLNGWQRVER